MKSCGVFKPFHICSSITLLACQLGAAQCFVQLNLDEANQFIIFYLFIIELEYHFNDSTNTLNRHSSNKYKRYSDLMDGWNGSRTFRELKKFVEFLRFTDFKDAKQLINQLFPCANKLIPLNEICLYNMNFSTIINLVCL